MGHEHVSIRTTDGECPTHVLTPEGQGPWPAVIFFMDALTVRPALVQMAGRLASAGYVVLLPDLFYRLAGHATLVPKQVFSGDTRGILGPMMASTDNARAAADTRFFLDYLGSRGDVAGQKVGATGYCMGGGMVLTAAGTYPDEFGAAASFHGGNLATDSPLSPHLKVGSIEAEVYVAGADNDGHYTPEMAQKLERALSDADVKHRCEIYKGALHGWTMPDFPVYNEPAAERAWSELLALLQRTLS
jgi:carboxymethylenebutenolidase